MLNGKPLLSDVVAPTDFLAIASGTLVQVPDSGRVLWVGLTTADDKTWQLVAFDPKGTAQDGQLRIAEGTSGAISGLQVRFDRVTSIPSAVGIGVPGAGGTQQLAQLTKAPDGSPSLTLVSSDRPALSLADIHSPLEAYHTFEVSASPASHSAARDAGAWFIWIATAMLLGGLAITFYVPRRRLWLRLTDDGTQIAALAEKSGGFEKDMRTLAGRMGSAGRNSRCSMPCSTGPTTNCAASMHRSNMCCAMRCARPAGSSLSLRYRWLIERKSHEHTA